MGEEEEGVGEEEEAGTEYHYLRDAVYDVN